MRTFLLTILTSAIAAAPAQADWWDDIDDGGLRSWVQKAEAQSPDLGLADASVDAARAQHLLTWSPLLPSLGVNLAGNVSPLEASKRKNALSSSASDAPLLLPTASALLTSQLRLDAGQTVTQALASGYDVAAAEDDREASLRTVAAGLGQGWISLSAALTQHGLLQRQLITQRRIMEIVETRFMSGEATAVELLQQRQQVAGLESQLPAARAQIESLRLQVMTLAGEPVGGEVPRPGPLTEDLPELKGDLAPDDLIRRRPDMQAAQRRVEAAAARTWSAAAGYLPTVTLSGQAGPTATYLDELNPGFTWGAGVTVSIPLFEGGRTTANVFASRALRSQAELRVRSLTLRAHQAAELALVRDRRYLVEIEVLEAQLVAAQGAAQTAEERYASGLTSYQSVLTAVTTSFQTEIQLLMSRSAQQQNRIALYDALGTAPLAEHGEP